MNKSVKTLVISLLLIIALPMAKLSAQVSTWDGTHEPWTHGTGTEADPFLIENAQQLAYLAYQVNNGFGANENHVVGVGMNYKMMVDIDLNGSDTFQWDPIGYWNSADEYYAFGGCFNGNNHTISGLYINSSDNRVGLFGYANEVVIENLSITNGSISTTNMYAGGIIGYAEGTVSTINCHNCCSISSTYISNVDSYSCSGGIVGYSVTSFFANDCSNMGNINSYAYCSTPAGSFNVTSCSGGILGHTPNTAIIYNCYNNDSISSTANCHYMYQHDHAYSGGMIGYASSGIIVNCYNMGSIYSHHNHADTNSSHSANSGGICGTVGYGTTIKNSYNTGFITSNSYIGGIVGQCNNSNGVVNSYYLNTCGGNNSFGEPKTETFMKSQEFVEVLNAGLCAWEYDYNNTNSGYPILTGILVMVTTQDASNITQSHATIGGIIETENTTIQSQGFEYKKTTDTDYSVVNVTGNGNIFTTLSDLDPNTAYTFRAFCTPFNCGTYYGQEKTFNTQSISVTTNNATDVTQTHATLNGNLNTGDANISSQGFQYKKTTDTDYQTVAITGSGEVSTTLSNLIPNTQYRFRLFCTPQGCDPIYGQEKTFNTQSISVATNNATDVSQTHATLNGNLNIGDANITTQGFQYKKTSDIEYQTIAVTGSGDVSTTLSDLTPNTQYRFRIFCIPQGCDPIYGQELYFNTLTINVTTYAASNVTESSATLNGYIDAGDAEVTNKGFKYWPTNNPQNVSTVSVSTTGGISATINNLAQNTYQYRAFVESDGNIYQGEIRYFEISWLNNDTIFVNDAAKLRWVAEQCNNGATFEGKYVKMVNDIELPLNVPNNMISIGSYPYYPFKGTFDGNGKHIYNLYIDQPNTPYQGFFGYTLNANLYNVGLVNITASGRNYTGGMVAYAKNTHLRDCYVNGGTLFALSYCGGLVGYQEQGTNSIISGCYNTCEVTGNNYVGGLIGFSNYSTVRNSYVAGRVAAQGEPVGAIIGGANEVLMYYCYFSIEMTGQTNAIGENNFKDGEGLTNEQMRDPQFVATLNQGLVTPVWKADYASPINNGFPIIMWQEAGTTGIEENSADKSIISLYPNPANNYVIIQSDDSSVSIKHMEVYDVMGRKVMSEILEGQSRQFCIAKLHAGVYNVRIQTSNGCHTHLKLVVQ